MWAFSVNVKFSQTFVGALMLSLSGGEIDTIERELI